MRFSEISGRQSYDSINRDVPKNKLRKALTYENSNDYRLLGFKDYLPLFDRPRGYHRVGPCHLLPRLAALGWCLLTNETPVGRFDSIYARIVAVRCINKAINTGTICPPDRLDGHGVSVL
jgi:hypothetical protein